MIDVIDHKTVSAHGRASSDMDRRMHGGDSAGPPARPSALTCPFCRDAIRDAGERSRGAHDMCDREYGRAEFDWSF